MNRITNIDEALQVTVGAGITISGLNRELHKIGLLFQTLAILTRRVSLELLLLAHMGLVLNITQ